MGCCGLRLGNLGGVGGGTGWRWGGGGPYYGGGNCYPQTQGPGFWTGEMAPDVLIIDIGVLL